MRRDRFNHSAFVLQKPNRTLLGPDILWSRLNNDMYCQLSRGWSRKGIIIQLNQGEEE